MNAPSRSGPGLRAGRVQGGGIFFKLLALVFLLVCAGIVYLMRVPLLRAAGAYWVRSDAPERADAILVLGNDDVAGDRARRAADLYRAGWAPVVVASGRFLRPYFSVAELIERDLARDGVPARAIVAFPQHATHTLAEAIALRGFCQSRGWRRVLVVTSNYHTRRTRYIFRKLFPPAIEVLVIAAPDQNYDPDAWWRSRESVKIFFLESIAYPAAAWEVHRLRESQAKTAGASLSSWRTHFVPFLVARSTGAGLRTLARRSLGAVELRTPILSVGLGPPKRRAHWAETGLRPA
jgi:uncharacterized SAM-binding protein YcdF (DUF218 family)